MKMKASTKIKVFIKKILPGKIVKIIRNVKEIFRRLNVLEENQRNLITSQFEDVSNNKKMMLRNKEFKIYSQNGEDGILLHIFSKIGTKNKDFVEFGIEDGRECNTANLSINHGWRGLLIEGGKENVVKAKEYYKQTNGRVKVIQCFITKDNINNVLKLNNVSEEIDLLSIDIDGNDYWVWKEIEVVNPRVVVIEYNGSFGDDKSISISYDPEFERLSKHKSGFYHGASLKALAKLGEKKGYALVGCDKTGCNAFFVKKTLVKKLDVFKVEEAFYPHSRRIKKEPTEEQFKRIRHLKFEKI